MSGSPLKHERNRLVREAVLRGLRDGEDPVEYVERLVVQPVKDILADPESPDAAKMAAVNFLADRIDGRPSQEIVASGGGERLVDAGLVGTLGELLQIAQIAHKSGREAAEKEIPDAEEI